MILFLNAALSFAHLYVRINFTRSSVAGFGAIK